MSSRGRKLFFFSFPLFFPLPFFMVCYHGHFLPHICTMHARGRKTKLCGMLLTAFLPPPPPLAHRFPYWAPHPRRWAAGFGCASMPRAGLLTVLYLTSRCHFPPTYVRPVLNYVVLLLLLLFIIVPFPLFSLFHILCV